MQFLTIGGVTPGVVSRVIIDNRSLAVTAPLLSRARQQALMFGRTLKAMKISEA